MMGTVDTLVRLLDKAERHYAEAQAEIARLAQSLLDRPFRQVNPDLFAKELGEIAKGSKIQAIRVHRQFTGLGLVESKNAIEQHWPTKVDDK